MNIKQLKRIIREEIEKLNEADEYKDGSKVMKSAADLISAIKTFKDSASESAKSHVDVAVLDDLTRKLDEIAKNPMNYIDATGKSNPAVKKAIFKPSAGT